MPKISLSTLKILLASALLVVGILSPVSVKAEPVPRWVKKGVKELNAQRLNHTYSFHEFHETDDNQGVFELDQFRPLLAYVDSVYGVSKTEITVSNFPADGALPNNYQLHFTKDGKPQTVYARLVDSYSKFSTGLDLYDEYSFYQLYAISEPGVEKPQFDDFIVTRKYNALPFAMSLIPGLGQIYKGQPAKGYSFLGIEAAMVACIIYSTTQVHLNNRLSHQYPKFYESYQSKSTTFREFRAFCLIAGGALYVYNLFDAAFAKGARYVKIRQPKSADMELSFFPFLSSNLYTQSYGLGVNITF